MNSDIPMNYVAFDIETTGLNPKYDKIIEIGAVRVRDGEVKETFSSYVNPARSLPERIVELTGIHDRDVEKAPYIEQILDAFLSFLGEDVLLGHNLLFDYSFVKKAAVNQKKTFEKAGIDTLRIAKRFLNDLASRNLGFLCEYYHIELEAHRALNDAVSDSGECLCGSGDGYISAQAFDLHGKKRKPHHAEAVGAFDETDGSVSSAL